MLQTPKGAEITVVSITNILPHDVPTILADNSRYEIKFAGNPINIRSGETLAFPGHIAYHVAKHIAMRSLQLDFTSKKAADPKYMLPMYTDEALAAEMQKVLGQTLAERPQAVISEAEKAAAQIAEVQAEFKQEFKEDLEITDSRTRAQIMQDIKAKGGKIDITMKKDDLLAYEKTLS